MESGEAQVVIVGAGLSGLATAVGLHRKGVRSMVLESSESLRASGFAFLTFTNAWMALDALGVADSLRSQHIRINRVVASSASTGATTSKLNLRAQGKCGEHEIRCVKRQHLMESLARELPHGTIRYSSKVVSIEEAGNLKVIHLADGSTLKAKVLIGCDGVNSVVSKWLGLKVPSFAGRSASRGLAEFTDGHGFKPEYLQFFGEGIRVGLLPCDERSIYWFFTYTPSAKDDEVGASAGKMKQFMVNKFRHAALPEEVIEVIQRSEMGDVVSSPLRFRWPFDLLWGNISKGNVCVAGDAFHPMTPDLGQGACSALEDAVVLARCLSGALIDNEGVEEEHMRINKALTKYAKERRWRSFELIATAYVFGLIQQSDGMIMSFLRDKLLSNTMARIQLTRADFDCGKL